MAGNSWQVMKNDGKGSPFSVKAVRMLQSLFCFFTEPLMKHISPWFQFPQEELLKVCSRRYWHCWELVRHWKGRRKKEIESEQWWKAFSAICVPQSSSEAVASYCLKYKSKTDQNTDTGITESCRPLAGQAHRGLAAFITNVGIVTAGTCCWESQVYHTVLSAFPSIFCERPKRSDLCSAPSLLSKSCFPPWNMRDDLLAQLCWEELISPLM